MSPARRSWVAFATLFADPRHLRSDLRLMRTAIRRGWLDDAPRADRDALVARFEAAVRAFEVEAFPSPGQRDRAYLAAAWVMIELMKARHRDAVRCIHEARRNDVPRDRGP